MAWKKKKHGYQWSLGDTYNLAIGQGFTLCTPIQLARLMAVIASNGKLFVPKLIKSEPEYIQVAITQENIAIVQDALYHAINSPGGTGYASRLDSSQVTMSGKTGTAQVIAKKSSKDDLNRESVGWASRNHAIFSGFAPSSDPRYVVSVYFDHAGAGGRAAAPIAKKLLQDALGVDGFNLHH
jgi:penicillin-binding protein 2